MSVLGILVQLAFPVALLALGCSLVAAVRERRTGRPAARVLALGTLAWFALAALGACMALRTPHDHQHLYWVVAYPLLGLFASAGLLTGGGGPGGAESCTPTGGAAGRAWARWAPLAAVLTLLALGALPLWILETHDHPRPPPRATGEPFAILVESVRYGFGGPVPTRMEPIAPYQVERGLGAPPREVTTPLGTTGTAAACATWLAWSVLLARRVRAPSRRRLALSIAPLALLLVSAAVPGLWLLDEDAIWDNAPWIVRSYGPLLLLAAASVIALAAVTAVAPHGARGGGAGGAR